MRTRLLPLVSLRVSTTGSRPLWVRTWADRLAPIRSRRSCSRWGRLQRGKFWSTLPEQLVPTSERGEPHSITCNLVVLVLVLGLNLLLLLEYWLNLLGASEIRVVLLLRR